VELIDDSRGTVPKTTFGASLRALRLSRNIALDAVAAHTKINLAFFQDLERDDLSKWPSNQFYRESYLRAYAEAIGLDPREVIDGFRRELGSAGAASTTAQSSKPRRLTPVTIPIILAVTFGVAYSLARWRAPALNAPSSAVEEPTAVAPAAIDSSRAPQLEPRSTNPPPSAPVATASVEADATEGELLITSTPPGARVLVNGIGRGLTPLRVRYLTPGSYTIRLVHPGYQSVTRQATISRERLSVPVSATLEEAR
jgi:cytoskeleton protein RodZ